VEERTVGPTLAKKNSAGIISLESGYGHDLSADVGVLPLFWIGRKYCLVLNLILLCALLSIIGATLKRCQGLLVIVLTVAWLLMPMCSSMNASVRIAAWIIASDCNLCGAMIVRLLLFLMRTLQQ